MRCDRCRREVVTIKDMGRIRTDGKVREVICRTCLHKPPVDKPLYYEVAEP